jgi:hypothetical protein
MHLLGSPTDTTNSALEMSTPLRWSSFETWNKLMRPPFLWKYPTFHIKRTRSFGCIPHSNRRQKLHTIIGETVVFLFGFCSPCLVLLVEVFKGQNLGLFPNLVLIFSVLVSSFSTQFSLILFNNRNLFVSTTKHIVQLESRLSNGK